MKEQEKKKQMMKDNARGKKVAKKERAGKN